MEPSRPVRITLRFGSNGGNPQHHTLRQGQEDCLRIGRDPASEVPVNLPGVSWAHAELRLCKGSSAEPSLCLRDLSSNGTGLKDGSGGIARVKRGVDVEVPLNSLVVLPLKIKAATSANALESRMCFAVELGEAEAPTPDPVQEALLAQARMAAEVQKAALQELAEVELAKAEAAVKAAKAEAALAPAAVASGERQEKTQKEGQEDQEAKATRQEAEEGPRLEAQAQSEKKRSPRSERSPARERDEGARSPQRPRSHSRSRSRSRHRSPQRRREDRRDGRRKGDRERRKESRDGRDRDGKRPSRRQDRGRRKGSSRSRSRREPRRRSRSRRSVREKRRTNTNFSAGPPAAEEPGKASPDEGSGSAALPADLLKDLRAEPPAAAAAPSPAPLPTTLQGASLPASAERSSVGSGLPSVFGPGGPSVVAPKPGLAVPGLAVPKPRGPSHTVVPPKAPGPLNLAEAAAKAAAALMAKEAPTSRRPLAGPMGPPFGPGRVAPRGPLGTLGPILGSPPEKEVEAPSFEIGSDVQVLSQGQWKIGTVLAETATGFLVLTDMEQLEVPAAEVRRPFLTPVKSPGPGLPSAPARGPAGLAGPQRAPLSPFVSSRPAAVPVRPNFAPEMPSASVIRPNLPLRPAGRPRPF